MHGGIFIDMAGPRYLVVKDKDRTYKIWACTTEQGLWWHEMGGRAWFLPFKKQRAAVLGSARSVRSDEQTQLRAPMPARVVRIFVRPKQKVKKGSTLLTLEAMKMEHLIKAPMAAVVKTLHVKEGAQVEGNALLVSLEATPS